MCWQLHIRMEHSTDLQYCSSLVSLVYTQRKASSWNEHPNDSTHSRTPAHIKGSVASLRNTLVGTTHASCIPGVAIPARIV